MALDDPPEYCFPPSIPKYSSVPRPEEQTLEYNVRVGGVRGPLGTITRTWKSATVSFKGQLSSDDTPTYGRNSQVDGEIDLAMSDEITQVSIKLEGRLVMVLSDSGSSTEILLCETRTLWQRSEAHADDRCPSILPFSVLFPSTFLDHQGCSRKLPPTCDLIYHAVPRLRVRPVYKLYVTVCRRRSKFSFWKLAKTYTIVLNYRPRSRPPRPIASIGRLFSSLKPQPEEWFQIVLAMKVRGSANIQPLECHLLLPSILTFGITETIPFHIQLRGPLASLQHFIPPQSLDHPGSPHGMLAEPVIKVSIARQVMVECDGRKSWRNLPLGEGVVRPIPPYASTAVDLPGSEVSADWEGDVTCNKDLATVGGFSAGFVTVRDFLVIEMTPPEPRTSPLMSLLHSHPIRLVTDTWLDETSHPLDL